MRRRSARPTARGGSPVAGPLPPPPWPDAWMANSCRRGCITIQNAARQVATIRVRHHLHRLPVGRQLGVGHVRSKHRQRRNQPRLSVGIVGACGDEAGERRSRSSDVSTCTLERVGAHDPAGDEATVTNDSPATSVTPTRTRASRRRCQGIGAAPTVLPVLAVFTTLLKKSEGIGDRRIGRRHVLPVRMRSDGCVTFSWAMQAPASFSRPPSAMPLAASANTGSGVS